MKIHSVRTGDMEAEALLQRRKRFLPRLALDEEESESFVKLDHRQEIHEIGRLAGPVNMEGAIFGAGYEPFL